MQRRRGPLPELFRNARMNDYLQCFESASGKRCLAATLHRYGKWPMIDGFTMFYILKNADFPSAHMYTYTYI